MIEPPRFDLSGKTALVTGASGSLGAVASEAFAAAGADVVVVGRARDKSERVAETVRARGRRAFVVLADITDADSVTAMAEQAQAQAGPIDILFNNAGITSPRSILELSPEEFQRVVDVSLRGTFLCTRAIVPGMIARGGGRIINMGSILSSHGINNRAAYCAAKAGVENLTRAMAIEFGPHKIGVNAIAPTVIVTDFNRELVKTQPQLYQRIIERTPFGRLGETNEILGALIFLASQASSFITGQTLYIDGGYTAW